MKKVYLLIIQLLIAASLSAQAYTINYFPSTYDSLVSYNSLSLELAFAGDDPFSWEHPFEFGFDFPFFGQVYDSVFFDGDGVGYFPGSPDFNLRLFEGWYTIDEPRDSFFLPSDIRYTTTEINGDSALIIEFHNVYHRPEFEENGKNHIINFQFGYLRLLK